MINNPIPKYVEMYLDYQSHNNSTKYLKNNLRIIINFLSFYSEEFLSTTSFNDVDLIQLSNIPIDCFQSYFISSSKSTTTLKGELDALNSFWQYLTNYSYNLQEKKPLFYRNGLNEWKIVNKETYHSIKYSIPLKQRNDYFTLNDMLDLLNFYDNYYPVYLDTTKKRFLWKKNKERNLAILALIMGAGLSLEELSNLTIRDIDMRKRTIIVKRNGQEKILKIFPELKPYISNYLDQRRKDKNIPQHIGALFLNNKNQKATTTMFSAFIFKLSKSYKDYSNKDFTSTSLRKSYGKVLFDKVKDIEKIEPLLGHDSLSYFDKYLVK